MYRLNAGITAASGGTRPIMPSNFEGLYIDIEDAYRLFIDVGVNGEKVHYQVFARIR